MKCPICKKDVAEGTPDFPFCGERCRLVDLGNWATDQYKIPSAKPIDEDPDADAPDKVRR